MLLDNTSILIKSFNRAFYIDRCIKSIIENVEGNYQIVVLDDGTPEKYLQKIIHKYPTVFIQKSLQYDDKVKSIEENLTTGKEINGFKIPADLWINAVKNASDYLIMTEDDVWFTHKINSNEIREELRENNIQLLKLAWLGYNNLSITKQYLSENIITEIPRFFTIKQPFLNWLFQDKYKMYSILKKLQILNSNTFHDYYALNSIAMGFYNKEYWLAIWQNFSNEINEKKQLLNAVSYFRKHKHPNFLGRFSKEILQTTFSSSATNSYHTYNIDININQVNHVLNEEWFNDNLDSMQNYPKDFSADYIRFFLSKNNFTEFQIKNWELWVEQFKNQYRNIGCNVD